MNLLGATSAGALLALLPAAALLFALVLCRVSAVVMLMPGLGEATSPTIVRAGIALGLTLLVAPAAQTAFTTAQLSDSGPIRVLALASVELFVGAMIGWLARLAAMTLPLAGQVLSLLTGLSSVLQPDAELGAEAAILGSFFSMLAPVIILSSGAYILPIQALVGSYTLVPPGGSLLGLSTLPLVADAAHGVTQITERIFLLALELIAPFILLSLLWQIALGIMSRLVPNLQVYNVATPLQIMGGIALLALYLHRILSAWQVQVFDILSGLPGL